MKLKEFFRAEEDRAVSPVIGVILMVAITVILAAVIGTFVLGLGEEVESNPSAGITIDGQNATLTSLGPNTAGIMCNDNNSVRTENVGSSIDCSTSGSTTDSIVAYRGDPTSPEAKAVVQEL